MALTIVANIHARPGKEQLIQDELQKLIEPTRKEEGCLQYDLHQDNIASGHYFMLYENWESRELWQTHMQASHLKAYVQATEDAVADFVLNEMERIA